MEAFIQLYGGQMLAIVGTLLGTWAGYRLRASDERKDKRRRIRATWGAISAEVEACKRMAGTYLGLNGQRVIAPQWRLPNVMLTSSLRALLADGDPTEPEVDALLKFHNEVEALNRGLDLAEAEVGGGGAADARRRMEVNDLKAQRLVEGGEYYAALRPLIDRHLN